MAADALDTDAWEERSIPDTAPSLALAYPPSAPPVSKDTDASNYYPYRSFELAVTALFDKARPEALKAHAALRHMGGLLVSKIEERLGFVTSSREEHVPDEARSAATRQRVFSMFALLMLLFVFFVLICCWCWCWCCKRRRGRCSPGRRGSRRPSSKYGGRKSRYKGVPALGMGAALNLDSGSSSDEERSRQGDGRNGVRMPSGSRGRGAWGARGRR